MARMEPCPGGRMASKAETPYMPRFEMVKVPAAFGVWCGGEVMTIHGQQANHNPNPTIAQPPIPKPP